MTIVKPGPVTVTKKDGSTKVETVTAVSRPFNADGVSCVYGYLDRGTTAASASYSRPGRFSGARRKCPRCGCTECGGPCKGPAFDPCFDCV